MIPKKNIFISGKITGDHNYRAKFNKKEKELTACDTVILNPACLSSRLNYESCIHICDAMLHEADIVYMLSDWKDSKGAVREHKLAKEQSKIIIYE